jgi:hypothetical protein
MASKEINAIGFAAAGLAIGLLLSWILLEPSQSRGRTSSAESSAKLTFAAAQLESRVEQIDAILDQWVEEAAASTGAEPTRISSAEAASPELAVRLLAVETSLAELTEAIAQLVSKSAAPASSMEVLNNTDHAMETTVLATLLQKEEVDLDLEHLGWSYQKVLDTYGKPTRNGPSPGGIGQKWYYFLEYGDSLIFWFQNDKVSRVLVN